MIKRVAEVYQARGKEEEYVKEMSRIRKEIVNLHGEMVLLENYSSINYTGRCQFQDLLLSSLRLKCSKPFPASKNKKN